MVLVVALLFGVPTVALSQTTGAGVEVARSLHTQLENVLGEYRTADEKAKTATALLTARENSLELKNQKVETSTTKLEEMNRKLAETRDQPVDGTDEIKKEIENLHEGIKAIDGTMAVEKALGNPTDELENKLATAKNYLESLKLQLNALESGKKAILAQLNEEADAEHEKLIEANEAKIEATRLLAEAQSAKTEADHQLTVLRETAVALAMEVCKFPLTMATKGLVEKMAEMLSEMESSCMSG